ncbi:hypothetical protein LV779_12780 [Streptomyces thinghirensis]|nr:hypothetical protein [Streptomyces thinghirensis]
MSTAVAVTFMIAVACYMLLPVYWLLVSSTKSQSDLVSTPGFLPAEWAPGRQPVLALRPAGRCLRPLAPQQPAVSAGLGAAVATLLAAAAGYALAKYTFRGREAVFSVVLGGVLVPATRTRPAALPDVLPSSTPPTPSGRCSSPASSARSASTSPASSPPRPSRTR